ncbi:hypothetical protein PsYK624_024890 [Phanerochaete sordida]|uniref:Uncharacterized protein n=1 Tax=Phanerochaete sordida TaxID=48140 RepID=A0A9P3L9D5_9APHY|nr:hypothetical protein PsYK624_024890 [Phanerochaete sordida]
MLAIPSAVRLQSSIAAPSAVSKRSDTSLGADQALHSHVDPLDGSLGPFLASCVLVLIVLLAVASVFYGVHRRTRLRLAAQLTVPSADSHRGLLSDVQLPPTRLRIRTPLARLRILRGGATLPLWHSPPQTRMAGPGASLPSIVLSRPSPVPRPPVSPSLTTFAPAPLPAAGSLRVPLDRWNRTSGAQKTKPKPLVQLDLPPDQQFPLSLRTTHLAAVPPAGLQTPTRSDTQPSPLCAYSLESPPRLRSVLEPQPQPLVVHRQVEQAKAQSPSKKASPGKSPKRAWKTTILGKENQPPRMQAKVNRTRKIFGSRDDSWAQIL